MSQFTRPLLHPVDDAPSTERGVDPAALAARGVAVPYYDAFGVLRHTPAETLARLAARLSPAPPPAPLVATPGRWHPELHGRVELEDGDVIDVAGALPADAVGYHHLLGPDGSRRLVLAAPEHLPQPGRTWGWAVQLYAARTDASWGIGDFADLETIARRARQSGAGMVLISPVHATAPTAHQTNSPYSPSSREWLNLQHVAVGQAPDAELVDLSDLAAKGRALNSERRIDRDRVWELKLTGLRRIWEAIGRRLPREAERFVTEAGEDLARFATYCVITEELGQPSWREWPEPLQRPDSPAVLAVRERAASEVAFWSWCQWIADLQFARACSAGVDVVADLAVGFDSCGADAWVYQDAIATGFEVGCPPDRHNREGQRWGLPPLDPDALVRMDLEPFVKMVRAGLRHAGALRMDHVMQLWRLFWVPSDRTAHVGAYVHYPVDALLAVLRIEAHRAGAWVCGEDMGTVAEGVRETMADIGMLGYRAAMRTRPGDNPVQSMATSSTHDQVTVAGCVTGSDTLDLEAIGKAFDPEHAARQTRDLRRQAGIDEHKAGAEVTEAEIADAVLAQYSRVAHSPSLVAVVTLDDAGAVAERPNMPGTVDAWPNWRLGLPGGVTGVLDGELAGRIATLMRGAGR
ncbi:4-alpha-glucanotransferase [Georgenia sp. 311]|uniref:4-alpha-glucanotransferase n=1 Tax=Georgenia wutianyii TaxID=2585135 RepID=A0ABX5VIE2_9MICO|nr:MULTISPECIES: 4-alpha-glucanotransferase [Georgenia]QDB78092.1 4-alpha-glucanotransferase [Georgenia wutianyii]TNC17536.1 4-alpha-glucanotransferase [Georgenia sp. 311]